MLEDTEREWCMVWWKTWMLFASDTSSPANPLMCEEPYLWLVKGHWIPIDAANWTCTSMYIWCGMTGSGPWYLLLRCISYWPQTPTRLRPLTNTHEYRTPTTTTARGRKSCASGSAGFAYQNSEQLMAPENMPFMSGARILTHICKYFSYSSSPSSGWRSWRQSLSFLVLSRLA